MLVPQKAIHPASESKELTKTDELGPIEVDTYNGKLTIEWDPEAKVTPIGQLPFFIQFLKLGGRLDPWIQECPLTYLSNNAPNKRNVLGSLFLAILSGHTRYAHLATLMSDNVNAKLLGMTKIVSTDSARRSLKKMEEDKAIMWCQRHLQQSYSVLLATDWILDVDATVKTLYGKQEGAVVGYNPKKRGRPSHVYHTYLVANLRLVLDVQVNPGNESQSSHGLPGLLNLLERLPKSCLPAFVRGDCDYGNNEIMQALEAREINYLFKLKKSKRVKELICKQHCLGQWTRFNDGFEVKEAEVQLMGWNQARRVVLVRRKLLSLPLVAIDYEQCGQQTLAFIDGPEDMRAYEYAVLVTNLNDDIVSLLKHYRDRADCENYFDEIKNQWGWGGFTTKDLKSCRIMALMIALIYNWWTLFARCVNPDNHMEAITSRPLLLSSIGKLTQSGRQQKMTITSQHNKANTIKKLFYQLGEFFNQIKAKAKQLTVEERWFLILQRAMAKFILKRAQAPPLSLPASC